VKVDCFMFFNVWFISLVDSHYYNLQEEGKKCSLCIEGKMILSSSKEGTTLTKGCGSVGCLSALCFVD
jgi:hypothetical protein